jgi:hypothetical protein
VNGNECLCISTTHPWRSWPAVSRSFFCVFKRCCFFSFFLCSRPLVREAGGERGRRVFHTRDDDALLERIPRRVRCLGGGTLWELSSTCVLAFVTIWRCEDRLSSLLEKVNGRNSSRSLEAPICFGSQVELYRALLVELYKTLETRICQEECRLAGATNNSFVSFFCHIQER